MKRTASYDYALILATVAVLFALSALCIYAMFAFKLAQVQAMPAPDKAAFMAWMNGLAAPCVILLILILSVCVPKRLLPTRWLNVFALLLFTLAAGVALAWGVKVALLVCLFASLALQFVVLVLAALGSAVLHFEKTGYWVRLGSSLIHFGIILFVLDLYFHRQPALHLGLFWVTTVATVLGMLFCFYSEATVGLVRGLRSKLKAQS